MEMPSSVCIMKIALNLRRVLQRGNVNDTVREMLNIVGPSLRCRDIKCILYNIEIVYIPSSGVLK